MTTSNRTCGESPTPPTMKVKKRYFHGKLSRQPRLTRAFFWMALLLTVGFVVVRFLYPLFFEYYTGVVNAPLTYESSHRVTNTEFEALSNELTYAYRLKRAEQVTVGETDPFSRKVKIDILMNTQSFLRKTEFPHIHYFREAGIRQYEGPKTCLTCHETMKFREPYGAFETVNTLEDVVDSVHFKFQSTAPGFTTYGYDGREVNAEGNRPIPVGKIDRACGIPGTFSWTGWAALVKSKPAHGDGAVETRSEGCGQCHIGGGYHPATEKMMPIGDVPDSARHGIDCLICHSQSYDMNFRHVIEDDHGQRWNQDRTLRAALTVTLPTNNNCLFCHQHNMGGDAFAGNVSAKHLGYKNRRLLHPGAKRGTPFSEETDVHAAAGVLCTDCHEPEGHKIPRGTKGTDLVANDLPGKKVACENCHTAAPHIKSKDRVLLNGHIARLACETCHITHLQDDNVVLRDWLHPVWDEEEGVYLYTDIYRSGKAGKGFEFLWFNGNGTFLANALGNNPVGLNRYNPLMDQMVSIQDPETILEIREQVEKLRADHYPDLDVEAYIREVTRPLTQLSREMLEKRQRMIRENIRPLMDRGVSKIYPFKMFNALMYEDMANQGPFGAMILPFDYPTYYETGNPIEAMKTAIQNPIVKRMYELPFKGYMMDEFMRYFGVDRWTTTYPIDPSSGELRNIEPHWMRQMGTLMLNHGIQKEGRKCKTCHTSNGIMDFKRLGYPPERVQDLENLRELKGRDL